jgi:hypothetical protein
VIQLARKLELEVIAEAIERSKQATHWFRESGPLQCVSFDEIAVALQARRWIG